LKETRPEQINSKLNTPQYHGEIKNTQIKSKSKKSAELIGMTV